MATGSGTVEAPDALFLPGLDRKSSGLAVIPEASGIVETDDVTGEVEALVSVTGVKDEVNDIIIPGAYSKTLKARKPKGVFSHDWGRWVARTESVEEWMPGDPRLPSKTREGDPWPADAGALYVKMRFNLNSTEGRDAYENVKFFSETGECEWSIGYHVPAGKASTGKDGIRHIKELDLFEYSPVLFGAAPLSGTLAVKSRLAPAQAEEEAIRALHEEGIVAIDWDAMLAAATDLSEQAEPSTEWWGEKTAGQNITPADRRNTERLIQWYEHGGGAAQIKWDTEGDFMRCVRIAGKHMDPAKAKGFCANRHKGATGAWPGHGAAESGKSLIDAWTPEAEVGEFAGTKMVGSPDSVPSEAKQYPFLRYSYEEAQQALRDALNERMLGETLDGGEGDREWSYVDLIGTFPDHCVARRSAYRGPNAGKNETYTVDYTIDPLGAVEIGEPRPVYIEVTAEVMGAPPGSDPDADGDDDSGSGYDWDNDTSPSPGFMVFAGLQGMDQAGMALTIAQGVANETKAGRMLSQANADQLKAAWERLGQVLKAAGVDIGGDGAPSTTGSGGAPAPDAATAATKAADVDLSGLGKPREDGTVEIESSSVKDLLGALSRK